MPTWIKSSESDSKMNELFIDDADLVVYSTAISPNHCELIYTKSINKTHLHRSELINLFTEEKYTMTVAGTHGKTTTTSLLAWIMDKTTDDTSYLLGGQPIGLPSAQFKGGKYLVLEADESDKSFLNYQSQACIVTNIEPDHLENHNNSFEEYLTSFKTFIHRNSLCIFNHDDPILRTLSKSTKNVTFISFGFSNEADFSIKKIVFNQDHQNILIKAPNGNEYSFDCQLLGDYNALNAVSAWVMAYTQKINPNLISNAISQFCGVSRRCEKIGVASISNTLIPVIDDYGHHPTECKAVLTELKKRYKQVIHVFEPHRYSRLDMHFKDFVDVLSLSDIIIIMDICPAGEEKQHYRDSHDLSFAIAENHNHTFYVKTSNDIIDVCNQHINSDAVILFQGVGSTIQIMAKECLKKWQ